MTLPFRLLAAVPVLLLTQCAVPAGGGGGSLASATKENPFVNSLGMKFVPVPGTNILMCTTETTVAQYKASGRDYESLEFVQSVKHPAANIQWEDARAWCDWLSKKKGLKYRLPTTAEWSAAVGGSLYPWGNSWPPPSSAGNYAGQELRASSASERKLFFHGFPLVGGFADNHKTTAPVASYQANHLGIHDLGGNVWEWCEDGEPQLPVKDTRIRGASWKTCFREYLSSSYFRRSPGVYINDVGFRCVVER